MKTKKKLLFWGPQSVSYWNRYFCAPAFERLRRYGWQTSYFFPPANEFGTGLETGWQDWFRFYSPLPDYRQTTGLSHSVFHYHDAMAVANMLREAMGQEEPDLVITRSDGHDYLNALFPGTPILTMGDAMGRPWFEQHCFSLSASENFHGLPHLSRHPDIIEQMGPLPDSAVQCFAKLKRTHLLSSRSRKKAIAAFDTLREQFSKLYFFPADYTGPDCPYLYFGYPDERYTTNADIIYRFLDETDDSSALLVTQHPSHQNHQRSTHMASLFRNEPRVLTAPLEGLSKNLSVSEIFSQFCDGLIVRNSKAFWYGLANAKPILNLGSQDLAILKCHRDFDSFLDATGPAIEEEEAIKIFYWYVTRQRVGLTETQKLAKLLDRVVEQGADWKRGSPPGEIFEWGTESDYEKSFDLCIRTQKPILNDSQPVYLSHLRNFAKTWIYGCSGLGDKVMPHVGHLAIPVAGVADTFRQGEWHGFSIASPRDLAEQLEPEDCILITSDYWEQIKTILIGLGIANAQYIVSKLPADSEKVRLQRL